MGMAINMINFVYIFSNAFFMLSAFFLYKESFVKIALKNSDKFGTWLIHMIQHTPLTINIQCTTNCTKSILDGGNEDKTNTPFNSKLYILLA